MSWSRGTSPLARTTGTTRCYWSGCSCSTCESSARSRTATDGVARALATALLSDAGYGVGRWVAVEQLIAQRSDGYHGALLDSTHGWHEDEADPWPWLVYFTGVLADAYRLFATRAAGATRTRLTKQQRVSMWFLEQAPVFFTVDEARTAAPGVSDQTIRLVLNALRDAGRIEADGPGRSARWRRLGS